MTGLAAQPFEVEFHAAPLPPPLDAFIEVVWGVKGMTFYQKETVLPNGGIELMINFGSLQRVLAFGSQASPADHPRYWVAGLQSQPLTIESTGASDLLSIRFRPGGAHAVFGLPIDELNDQVIDLDLLPGMPIETLRSRLAAAASFRDKLSLVQEWLLSNLRTQEYEHRLVAGAVAAIQQAPGGQRIGDLCEQIGLSHKHTIDLFRRVVGVPPKTLARILRFNKLVRHVSVQAQPDWARLAAQFNYYDQSHLIREFQRLAGVSPMQYLARRTPDGTSLLVD
jgi:AraC-like DNA-binding protein